MKARLSFASWLVLSAVSTLAAAQGPASDQVAASGPALSITVDELRDEVRDSRLSGDMARVASTLTADGLERILTAIADQKRLAAEARRVGLDRDPLVAREIESVTNAMLTDALEGRLRAQTDTSPESLRAFYDANAGLFRTPGRRKARHVVVATEQEAEAALSEVRRGTPFQDVARLRNTDSTRKTGGELGWVPKGLMVSGFEEVLFSTPVGKVAGPVKTNLGWHLVLVEEIDPGTLPELALIEDAVVEAMKSKAFADVRARLRDAYPVQVNRRVVEELLK